MYNVSAKYFYMNYSLISILGFLYSLFYFFYGLNNAAAQPNINSNLPCYSIATAVDGTSILYELNSATSQWKVVDQINRNNVKALAVVNSTNTIYTVHQNKLGTINPITAEFSDVGTIGSGNGAYGNIILNDIYGLTYVPYQNALYATHRIYSYNSATNSALANSNDILFKINPSTGKIVLGAFDFGYDYVKIQEIANSTISVPTIYDVSDIAFDPSSGELLVLHGYQLALNDIITSNSLEDGTTETIKTLLFKPSIGITYDAFFDVFVTTLPDLNNSNYSGDIYKVNVLSSDATRVGTLDPSLTEPVKFNCLNCLKNSVSIVNCQPIIYLNDYSPARSNYNAQVDIYSNDKILSTSTTYRAGNSVTLSNDFSVPANVNFTAKIESCN